MEDTDPIIQGSLIALTASGLLYLSYSACEHRNGVQEVKIKSEMFKER